MTFVELIMIAIGLSMDAFAVSISNAMALKKLRITDALKFAVFFGVAQAIMPLIGWLFGSLFSQYVVALDHWIAFVLLSYIGGKMIYDVCSADDNDEKVSSLNFKTLFFLAVATSIDALAVGVTFAFMEIPIISSIIVIGLITFALCFLGAYLGKKAGNALGDKAQLAGGIILILIGLKILIEHLFFV